jgi:outer membrane protein assembly factor BamB
MDQKSSINSQLAPTEEELFQKQVQKRSLIFVGTVLSLGKPPANWSGYLPAYQTVHYKVEKVLKGQLNAAEIAVEHIVVWGSKTAQSWDTPGLSTVLFAVGSKLIAFAQKSQDGVWKELDEDLGAIPFSDDSIRKVETALRKK